MLVRFLDHEVTQSYYPGTDCTKPIYPNDKEYIEIDLPYMPNVGERFFFDADIVCTLIKEGIKEKYEETDQILSNLDLGTEMVYTGVINRLENRVTKDGFIVEANTEFEINDYSYMDD